MDNNTSYLLAENTLLHHQLQLERSIHIQDRKKVAKLVKGYQDMLENLEEKRIDETLEFLSMDMKRTFYYRQPPRVLTVRARTKASFPRYLTKTMKTGTLMQPTPTNRPNSGVFIRVLKTEEELKKIWPDLLKRTFKGDTYAVLAAPVILKYRSHPRVTSLSISFKYTAHHPDGNYGYNNSLISLFRGIDSSVQINPKEEKILILQK